MLTWLWKLSFPERDWESEWDEIEDVITQAESHDQRIMTTKRRAMIVWNAYTSLVKALRQWASACETQISMI